MAYIAILFVSNQAMTKEEKIQPTCATNITDFSPEISTAVNSVISTAAIALPVVSNVMTIFPYDVLLNAESEAGEEAVFTITDVSHLGSFSQTPSWRA
jgi:hypothetical protein